MEYATTRFFSISVRLHTESNNHGNMTSYGTSRGTINRYTVTENNRRQSRFQERSPPLFQVEQAIVICFSLFLTFCPLRERGLVSYTFARRMGRVWIISKFNLPPNYIELFNMKSKYIQTLYSSLVEITKSFENLMVISKDYACLLYGYTILFCIGIELFSPNHDKEI